MPHSPDLIDSILKEAGFFDDMKLKLTGFLQSREKKRAVSRVGAHFDSKNKDWDRVVSNSSRKSFVKELAGDARADDKLKMHVDSMNRLKTGKVLSTISGTEGSRTARRDGSQSYKIVKLRGSNRLGCTCRDWRFKKSVAAQGEQADCKHIREFKQMNKTAAAPSWNEVYLAGVEKNKQFLSNRKGLTSRQKRTYRRETLKQMNALPTVRADKGTIRDYRQWDVRPPSYEDAKLTLRELKKEAGHVEDRIAERAPGSTYEVAKIEAQIPSMKLRKGQTYHVPLKRGKGYAVIGDIGPKHVVKTVLGPNMRPPGHRAKAAMADVSSRSMQKGDVVVMTMGPKTYIGKSDSSLAQRAKERIFRKTSPAMQGGYTHSGIYVGKGQIVEARRDGVRKRSLRSALKNIDGAVVVRPKAGKKAREGAAEFAKSRVGAAYESEAFLTRQGVSLLAPKRMEKLLKRKSDIESTKKFTCGNLVSAAYVSQGFTPRKDNGEWSLTVPADFLNADKADRVKAMGSYADAKAKVGRLAGQKLARAPRDYKQEYAEYHGKPDQVSNRSLRNQARRKMGLKKGDPREVDHKTPISKGGGNGKGNLSAVSREFNRRKFNGS